MALESYKGVVTAPASTGSQAITGLGFQPKVIVFWGADPTALNERDGWRGFVGVQTRRGGSGQCWASSFSAQDAVSGAPTSRALYNAVSVHMVPYVPGSAHVSASVASFDADGFTLSYNPTASGAQFHFLAWGGSAIEDAVAGTFNTKGSTGTQDVTGLGFNPNWVLLASACHNVLNAVTTHACLSLGMATGPAADSQALTGFAAASGVNPQNSLNVVTNDRIYGHFWPPNGASFLELAAFNAWLTGGFQLNYTIADGTARNIGYLAVRFRNASRIKMGKDVSPGSVADDSVTGVGFQPKSGLFLSGARLEIGLFDSIMSSLGGADEALRQGHHDITGLDAVSNSSQYRSSAGSGTLIRWFDNDGTTERGRATLQSWDADGFTLDWAVNDQGRNYWYFVAGDDQIDVPVPAAAMTLAGPAPAVAWSAAAPSASLELAAASPQAGVTFQVPAAAMTLDAAEPKHPIFLAVPAALLELGQTSVSQLPLPVPELAVEAVALTDVGLSVVAHVLVETEALAIADVELEELAHADAAAGEDAVASVELAAGDG